MASLGRIHLGWGMGLTKGGQEGALHWDSGVPSNVCCLQPLRGAGCRSRHLHT